VLAGYASDVDALFSAVIDLLAGVTVAGQALGEIRTGDPHALVHLYSVLVNEHIFLDLDARGGRGDALSQDEFHALVDSALRARGRRRPTAKHVQRQSL